MIYIFKKYVCSVFICNNISVIEKIISYLLWNHSKLYEINKFVLYYWIYPVKLGYALKF